MENLGIDGRLLIAQLINFGLFFVVFRKFLAKPFLTYLQDQKTKAVEQEKIFQKANGMESKLAEREKELKDKAKKEAAELLKEAKKSAEAIHHEAISTAQKDADALIEKTKKQLASQEQELMDRLSSQVKELSFAIVNQALKDALTEDVRKTVTESIIKNSPKNLKMYEN